ncbi:MAG TPA: hypothetical protein VMY42_09555 [Thermoguttaceae bacterium]|nr:hypothetical protein [Thermoguttaceae bacterium]
MASTSERRAPRHAASPNVPGCIESNTLYTLPELEARLKVGAWGLRMARRAGLPMLKMGKRKFVLGADVIRFLQDKPASEPAENPTVED